MTGLSGILDHVPPATLVVFRVSGLMIYGPVFGSRIIVPRIKVALAVVIGLAVYPVIASRTDPTLAARLSLWELPVLIVFELMIGLLIGFVASLPFLAVQVGGLVMGQQMGLGFARFFNPAVEDEADVLGSILFFTILAAFLVIGGHEAMVLAVMHSFDHLPVPAIGSLTADGALITLLTGTMNVVIELSLRVAAPLLALIFAQTLALGFVAKTVPQMNILSLGFPMRILLGLGIVTLGLAVTEQIVMENVDSTLELIFAWIEGV